MPVRPRGVVKLGDADPAALTAAEGAALLLGKTPPDTCVLCGVERPLQARLPNGAQRANCLRGLDLCFGWPSRPDGEEELRVDVAAACSVAPIHQSPRFLYACDTDICRDPYMLRNGQLDFFPVQRRRV
jgi:hypothetical protein